MSARVDSNKDLCTDAIPEPPRGETMPQQEVPKYEDKGAQPTPQDQPSEDANHEGEEDSSAFYQETRSNSQERPFRDDPKGGFSQFPNGSIIISNSVGPIHVGNVNTTTVYAESSNQMHRGPTQYVPKTDQVQALFKKEDWVTEKDLRYLKKHISIRNFRDTARELGYSDEFMERYIDPNKPEEMPYKVLLDWIRNKRKSVNGYDPTMSMLAITLWKTGSQFAVAKWADKVFKK